ETTLHINGDWQLLPGGIVGMKKGKILSISCEANGTGFVPQWNYSAAPRIHVESEIIPSFVLSKCIDAYK
ncbi:hypothetical protein NPIL_323941, partial [Nephila pilipes]